MWIFISDKKPVPHSFCDIWAGGGRICNAQYKPMGKIDTVTDAFIDQHGVTHTARYWAPIPTEPYDGFNVAGIKPDPEPLRRIGIYLSGILHGKGNVSPLEEIDIDNLWDIVKYLNRREY